MTIGIHIRPAESRDILRILAIARHSPESSQWSSQEYARVLAAAFESSNEECVVAERDDTVAGFMVTRAVADEMEILNLAVTPQSRRQGIATALLGHALAASRTGASRAFLEVRESNSAALAFYTRHSFLTSGRRRAYYSSPVEDAIILSRALRLPPGAEH